MSGGAAGTAGPRRPGRARLLWHTVRHLRAGQILARLRLQAQASARRMAPGVARRWYDHRAARAGLLPPGDGWVQATSDWRARVVPADWDRAVARAGNARLGRFTFLNGTTDLGRPVAWDAPGQSQLWRYQLHYGAYLVDLVATQPDGWPMAAALMDEWVSACPMAGLRDAWHPFVVSERLINWSFTILLGAPAIDAVPDRLWHSLAVQTTFVDRNLETDVGGNHLLKNLKAMVVASTMWRGATASRWRARYVTAFDGELAAQLLRDGMHYERSPMYHLLVLLDAVEVVLALRRGGFEVPASLLESLRLMAAVLGTMTHPDGEIALFNDSVFGEAPAPALVAAAAAVALGDRPCDPLPLRVAWLAAGLDAPPRLSSGGVARQQSEDGGLVRVPLLGGRGLLIVDVGRACPDTLPAHAHADFFSYELSLDGRRLIVDAGVGEYAAGAWREYYRSTRAHNTVSVDDADQIECWGSFRVARRANVFDRATLDVPRLAGITAGHDGYRRLADPVDAVRTLVALDDRAWLVIDELRGAGSHVWESCIHAAPEAGLVIADGGAILSLEGRRLAIAWFGPADAAIVRGRMEPRQGWHAPEFGVHQSTSVLQLRGRGVLPVRFGYLLVPDRDPDEVGVSADGLDLDVRLGACRYRVAGSGRDLCVTGGEAA